MDDRTFNIHVAPLSNEIESADLILYFQRFGTVSNARVIRDATSGRTRGYGFVNFDNQESQRKAIEQGKAEIKGQDCVVQAQHGLRTPSDPENADNNPLSFKDSDAKRTLYIRNVPVGIPDAMLQAKFQALVTDRIEKFRANRDYCFLTFEDFSGAERALGQLKAIEDGFEGRQLLVQFSKTRKEKVADNTSAARRERAARTVYVRGFGSGMTELKLRKKFEIYGPTNRITLVTNGPRPYGFVEYSSRSDALEAQRVLDQTELNGETIAVQISRADSANDRKPPAPSHDPYSLRPHPAHPYAPPPGAAARYGAHAYHGYGRTPPSFGRGGYAAPAYPPAAYAVPAGYLPYDPTAGGPPPVAVYDPRSGQYVLAQQAKPEHGAPPSAPYGAGPAATATADPYAQQAERGGYDPANANGSRPTQGAGHGHASQRQGGHGGAPPAPHAGGGYGAAPPPQHGGGGYGGGYGNGADGHPSGRSEYPPQPEGRPPYPPYDSSASARYQPY